jgi:hypothetical protein
MTNVGYARVCPVGQTLDVQLDTQASSERLPLYRSCSNCRAIGHRP